MTTTMKRNVLIVIAVQLLAIIALFYLILAYAGSDEEQKNDPDTLEESLRLMWKAQDELNEELMKFIGDEDRATGRKPLVERLKEGNR